MEGVEANQKSLLIALANIVQANRAIDCSPLVLAPRQQIIQLLAQPPLLLLLLLLMKNEYVPVGANPPLALEHRVQAILDVIKEPKRMTIHEAVLHFVDGVELRNIHLLLSWLSWLPLFSIFRLFPWKPLISLFSFLSSWLIVLKLISISIIPLPKLRLIISISFSRLLIILRLSLWLPGEAIIASITILALVVRMVIKLDLIIIAIESKSQIVMRVSKAIGIAIDLHIQIAVLQMKSIMITIDRQSQC